MKKLLGIILLGFLMSVNVYASCVNDLDVEAEWGPGKVYLLRTIKNKGNMDIKITRIKLMSKNGKLMREKKPDVRTRDNLSYSIGDDDFYVKPYGVSKPYMRVDDLNLDVAGKSSYACKYGALPVFTDETNKSSNSNSSSSSSSNSSKSKQQSETSGSSKSLLKKLLGKD